MILCVGTTPTAQRSMTFARVERDEVNRAVEVAEYASGKSINVARVLRVLGKEAVCTGFVGGRRGEMIREDLDGLGIAHDFVGTGVPTRLCTTVIDRATGEATELVEESAPVDEKYWGELDGKVKRHLAGVRGAVFSGSLPPGGDLGAYGRWAGWALDAGVGVVIDGRGEVVRRALSVGRFTLKLNRVELAATVGEGVADEGSLKGAMRRALPDGGRVVVTLGKEGAVGTEGGEFYWVRTPAVGVVSAVGSGDAFAAGLAAALEEGRGLSDAMRLGAACGAANAKTSRAGEVGRGVVEEILEGTVVRVG